MKGFGLTATFLGAALMFFAGIVGVETSFGFRVANFPAIILGATLFLGGLILFAAGSMSSGNSAPQLQAETFDRKRWDALVSYDVEIGLIAEKLKPLGKKWSDEFAGAYLALEDKKYLPNIVEKIIARARKESEEKGPRLLELAATCDLPWLPGREGPLEYSDRPYFRYPDGRVDGLTTMGWIRFSSFEDFKNRIDEENSRALRK